MARKKLDVKVIGCGGIGGCLLNVLPRFMLYQSGCLCRLSLFDGDAYEERNQTRQNAREVGNKAEVTAAGLRKEFPGLSIMAVPEYVTKKNIKIHLESGDVIFSCVDNDATRLLLSDYCEKLDDCVVFSGGNELYTGHAQIFVRKGKNNLTVPVASTYHDEIRNPQDVNPGEIDGCDDLVVVEPQFLPTNNLAAAYMFCMFSAWLEGVFEGKKEFKGKIVQPYDEVFFSTLTCNATTRTRKVK